MAKAWLITHPETKLDRAGRIHGNLDPPLSYSGKIHAGLIAAKFKNKKPSAIHSSPRQRALDTAKMISEKTGVPVSVNSALEPWDLASMSGAKVSSIRPLLDYFSKHSERTVPGGEAKDDVLKRYSRFMKTVKPGAVVVGHSQHSLAFDYAKHGGKASDVPMVGGKPGEVREVEL